MIAECINEPVSQYNVNVITERGDIIHKYESICYLPLLKNHIELKNKNFLLVDKF